MEMQIHETIEAVRHTLDQGRRKNMVVGFVPTMGALHAGHLSLVTRARQECDFVLVSIFVNPLQFGPNEDFDRYHRPFDDDIRRAAGAGVDGVFAPSVDEMYPEGEPLTRVGVDGLSEPMEGAQRPGHFEGVTTVVAKLFHIVGECTAYFGEKDWQQLAIIRQMVTDLCFQATIVGCPIVRESDGLALSSRNANLSPEERRSALALRRSLDAGVEAVSNGTNDIGEVKKSMIDAMTEDPRVDLQYAEVVDEHLRVPRTLTGTMRLLVAARIGETRLIDNASISVTETR